MQKINTERKGDKVIILLQGDLDASDQRLLKCFHSPKQANQEFNIWIDCANLTCIRSHGFCHFINQLLLLKHAQANITLLNLQEPQRKLLRMLQVAHLFTVVPEYVGASELVQAS